MKAPTGPHGSEGMAGEHVHSYVRDKTYNQGWIGYMYGLMAVYERLCHVCISTNTAGKSDTKEDLPRNLILL